LPQFKIVIAMPNECTRFPALSAVFLQEVITSSVQFIPRGHSLKLRSTVQTMKRLKPSSWISSTRSKNSTRSNFYLYENNFNSLDSVLSRRDLAPLSTDVPFSADLLSVCDRGDQSIWSIKGKHSSNSTHPTLPSFPSGWV
jgi:hypothetical protein